MLMLLSFILIGISIGVHEAGHAIMSFVLRVPFEYISIGIPLNIRMGRFKWNGVIAQWHIKKVTLRLGILPFGGGVQIHENVFWNTLWWKRFLIALAGPAFSLAFAYMSIALFLGPEKAIHITHQFTLASGEANMMLLSGGIPLSEINGPIYLIGLITQAMEISLLEGAIFMLALINVSIAATNMLPIPALDGGQAVIALVSAFAGNNKFKKVVSPGVRSTFYILLIIMMLLCIKDLLQ